MSACSIFPPGTSKKSKKLISDPSSLPCYDESTACVAEAINILSSQDMLPESWTVIDIGAELGTMAHAWIAAGAQAVYAVEESEESIQLLNQSLPLMGIEEVVAVQSAADFNPDEVDIGILSSAIVTINTIHPQSWYDTVASLMETIVALDKALMIIVRVPANTPLPPFVDLQVLDWDGIHDQTVKFIYRDLKELKEWQNKIKTFVGDWVRRTINKDPAQYMTPEYMEIWYRAFTNKSFNPEPNGNYELLEFYGDEILDTVVANYLGKRFPTSTQHNLNFLKSAYVDKPFLRSLSVKFGFDKLVRVRGLVTIDTKEDLMESFIGAFEHISNSIKFGLGYINITNWVTMVYNDIDIDVTKGEGPPSMLVQQAFLRLKIVAPGKEGYRSQGNNLFEMVSYKVIVPIRGKQPVRVVSTMIKFEPKASKKLQEDTVNQALDMASRRTRMTYKPKDAQVINHASIRISRMVHDEMDKLGVNLPEELGHGSDPTSITIAIKNAYAESVHTIRKAGATPEFIDVKGCERDFMYPDDVRDMYPTALAKAQQMGYVRLCMTSQQTSRVTTVTLQGITQRGRKQVLMDGIGDELNEAKADVLSKFLQT